MSYERALEIWKQRPVEPPPLSRVEQAHRTGASVQPATGRAAGCTRWGLRMAMLGFVAMAIIDNVWRPQDSGRTLAVLLPVALLVFAERCSSVRRLDAQMLVRGIAWSNLVIGVIVSVWDFQEFAFAGAPIALGSGLALLGLGGHGLGISGRWFRPVAFRVQLLIALVMAMADAETLMFSGIVEAAGMRLASTHPDYLVLVSFAVLTTPALIAAGVMLLAVWGLLRMRTWAFLLNVVANVVIAGLALWGTLELTLPVAGALSITAVIQLLLVVPILAAAVGDDNPDRPPLRSWGPRVARATIVLSMLAAAAGAFIPSEVGLGVWRTGWVARTHRTNLRGLVDHESRAVERDFFWRRSGKGGR